MSKFDHPVVAVGASAGGIEALKSFVANIPSNTAASFVILQHLAPDHESQLTEILERSAHLPVIEADEKMAVEPGHIYVLGPNRYLTIVDHGLFTEPPTEPRGLRMPIDHFMRSLADAANEQAVGVILSGTGSDGTLGMRAIKGAGGVAMVQSPDTSLYSGMPQAAIDAGVVDTVGSIADLCETILELSQRGSDPADRESFDRKTMAKMLALLKARTGQDFGAYKGGTITRRVRRRMNLLRFDDLNDYLVHLRDNAEEVNRLFDDLLINVTCFFRDDEVWDKLADEALKPMIEAHDPAEGPLRFWVAACSTGEEAFTLAILLEEICSLQSVQKDWQIFASDLDTDAIAKGREAFYSESTVNDVSAERRKRFFRKEGSGWRVDKRLRERVVFAQQNVLTDPPFSKLNMVSCRNLLIYLDNHHQSRLLETFHFALNEGGVLFLGTSETIGARTKEFGTVSGKAHIYRRKAGRSVARLNQRGADAQSQSIASLVARTPREQRDDLTDKVRSSLLQRYAPAAAALRANGEIAYFHGPVRRFLETPEGAPSQNIFDMLPASLRSRVREAVRQVSAGEQPSHRSAPIRFADRDTSVCVECEAITTPEEKLFLVTFIENDDDVKTVAEPSTTDTDYIRQLEHEIAIVREDLQTTVEELETSNEELKASHEEAVAANEELQSANEELETSREELQSLNEELITVNNQLEEKIGEVEKATDDMRNLLTSTRLPVLFLNPELEISGYTPTMSGLVELRESDVGRPISELAMRVEDPDILDDARQVLADLSQVERELSAEGKVFLRRIQPYRTSDERIGGVVVTFTDISQQANMTAMLASRERQQRIVAELGQSGLMARDIETFLSDACASLRVAMDCDYAKVLKWNQGSDRLELVAGAGWKSGLVGKASVETGVKSQGGYTLRNEDAVLVEDFDNERRFDAPDLLANHAVASGISCRIMIGGKPWGVIGIHDRAANAFQSEDLATLQAAANIIAATIMQIEREAHLSRERLMLSLAIRAADMGVWHLDAETDEAVWDERLRTILGAADRIRQPTGEEFFQMIAEADRDTVRERLQRTIESGDSYGAEFRLIRPDGSMVWLSGKGERVIENGRVSVLGINADITQRKTAEEHGAFIMRELDHRVKNVLAIILSVAQTTGKQAATVSEFVASFSQRLHAMARTHSLLAEARWQGTSIRRLVEDELGHSIGEGTVEIDGPDVAVSPSSAQGFSMALHELGTNALKYGALSVPAGKVTVSWRVANEEEHPTLLFDWVESGGPTVQPPKHRGFGSTVIERILRTQMLAQSEIQFEPGGLEVHCKFPMDRLTGSDNVLNKVSKDRSLDFELLQGAKVLVLDDEWLVADQTSQYLGEAGMEVIGPFHALEEARDFAEDGEVDLAVLDYNIDGTPVTPLVQDLQAKGVPVIIVSGYGSRLELPQGTLGVDFMPKPVAGASLIERAARRLGTATATTAARAEVA